MSAEFYGDDVTIHQGWDFNASIHSLQCFMGPKQSVNCLVSQALTELDGMTRLMRGLRQVTAFTKEVVNLGPDSHTHKQ